MAGPARLDVVGLGPAGAGYLTSEALALVRSAERLVLRTARHPAAERVLELRPDAETLDEEYERGESFAAVYRAIADRLLEAAQAGGLCYAVPGSPSVAERSVELLLQLAPAAVAVELHPALSFLDLAWQRLALDPAAAGLRLADASSFARSAAGGGPLLVCQVWSRQVLSDVKLSLEEPPEDQVAVVLHHLGLPDELVAEVPWSELDRSFQPDHLTSLYVASLPAPPGAELVALGETVALLRRSCPWDREQTHRSLLRHLLEEAYEAIEALEALGDEPAAAPPEVVAHAEEELGDLLCQVFFHSTLGEEEGLFTLGDVARRIDEKLVLRHPHVFGEASAHSAADVAANWERRKDAELGRTHLLEGIPAALPALARLEKYERKLKSVGLGYDAAPPPRRRLEEALSSFLDSGREAPGGGAALGELLLELGRLGAARGLDPEGALRGALGRLAEEVRQLEQEAAAAGSELSRLVAERPLPQQDPPLC